MSKLYVGHEHWTLSLDTQIDISGATTREILYIKPDGTTGAWAGTEVGTSIEYNILNGDIDQAGAWIFQTHVIIAGRDGYGRSVRKYVYPLGH